MAHKAEVAPADNDLEILHPEQALQIGGRSVTVREYGFVEGLRVRPKIAPFLDDLYATMQQGEDIELEVVLDIIGRHHELMLELIAQAADVDQPFLEQLTPEEGDLLLMTWWVVNGPFVLRQLQTRLLSQSVQLANRAKLAARRVGATSTPTSSPTATTPTASDATPSDSSCSTPTPAPGASAGSEPGGC